MLGDGPTVIGDHLLDILDNIDRSGALNHLDDLGDGGPGLLQPLGELHGLRPDAAAAVGRVVLGLGCEMELECYELETRRSSQMQEMALPARQVSPWTKLCVICRGTPVPLAHLVQLHLQG